MNEYIAKADLVRMIHDCQGDTDYILWSLDNVDLSLQDEDEDE